MNNPVLLSLGIEWMGVVAVVMLAGASARFARRPLVFKYARREILYALGLFALVIVAALIIYALLPPSSTTPDLLPLPRLAAASLAALVYGLAVRLRGQPVRSIGWNPATLRPSVTLGLALALLAVFLRGRLFTVAGGLSTAQLNGLLVWAGIALAEETVFRGYIQQRLVSAWGKWPGIAAAALLFTLWQLPLKLALGLDAPALALGLLVVFVQGAVAGYAFDRSGHVLTSGMYRAFSEWISLL